MAILLVALGLVLSSIALVWGWFRFNRQAVSAAAPQGGEMSGILYALLVTALVCTGTAAGFRAVMTFGLEGPAWLLAVAVVAAVPFLWVVLVAKMSNAAARRSDAPSNENRPQDPATPRPVAATRKAA
jgi:protein-S-isoprenylcysteine O-methyltransferase Ste14